MDITSPFKSEIFRPLVTLVIPGAVALAPYILVVSYYFPQVVTFWNEHPSAFVAILVVCVVATGLFLENLGSTIEWNVFDEILDRRDSSHKSDWEEYLQLWLMDEVVGQRYLRQSLIRMKFELSMIPSLFFFLCGLLWANRLHHIWQTSRFIWLAAVVLILIALMVVEAFRSATNLARTRSLIITASKSRPAPTRTSA